MWVQDTVPKLTSWVSPLGWPESKVTIFLWLRIRHRMVACTCQAEFKNLVSHSTSVAQVQLNRHNYASSHHRRKRPEYCRKLASYGCSATLQKVREITKSHSGIPRCVELCMPSCLSGIRRAALRCSRLPWNSTCTMLFWNARMAQMLLTCQLNSPPSCGPERLYAGSNSF